MICSLEHLTRHQLENSIPAPARGFLGLQSVEPLIVGLATRDKQMEFSDIWLDASSGKHGIRYRPRCGAWLFAKTCQSKLVQVVPEVDIVLDRAQADLDFAARYNSCWFNHTLLDGWYQLTLDMRSNTALRAFIAQKFCLGKSKSRRSERHKNPKRRI